jgi:hypothetical protein
VRSGEKIGSQPKAPAPPNRKFLWVNVGQTLSSANPVLLPIFPQLLRELVPFKESIADRVFMQRA